MIIIIATKNKRFDFISFKIGSAITANIGVFLLFLFGYFIKSPILAQNSVRAALGLCAFSIIPALFPFTAVTRILISTGILKKLTAPINKPISYIFGIPEEAAYAIIIGAIGGFPLGAVCLKSLYDDGVISNSEAARLCAVSNNASPAFCIGAVGVAMFSDKAFGVKLYLCQLLAVIFLGIISRQKASPRTYMPKTQKSQPFSEAVCTSIIDSGAIMIKVCSFAIFFTVIGDAIGYALTNVFSGFRYINGLCAFVTAFFELTLACSKCTVAGVIFPKLICAFAVGFGGLSVYMQVSSVMTLGKENSIILKGYLKQKLLQGIISVVLMILFSV